MHIASNTTGTVEYYHVDHLGSTRLKTNSTGGVVYESNYEPFGVSSGESGDENYRYTGKQEDITGLYYYGARYYDPDTGRFITRDTVMGDLTDPQSLNRYVYCRNNPHKYVDPDGHIGVQIVLSVEGGFFGFGATRAGGTAWVWGKNGLETGSYTSKGHGLFIGVGAGCGLEITITPFAMTLDDLEGRSVDVGGIVAIGPRGGLDFSFGEDEEGKKSLKDFAITGTLGVGAEVGGTLMWTDTTITQDSPIYDDKPEYQMFLNPTDHYQNISDWDKIESNRH